MIVVLVWGICNFPYCYVADYKIQTGNTSSNLSVADRCWLTEISKYQLTQWITLVTKALLTLTEHALMSLILRFRSVCSSENNVRKKNQNERWQWEATSTLHSLTFSWILWVCICSWLVYCIDACFPTTLKKSRGDVRCECEIAERMCPAVSSLNVASQRDNKSMLSWAFTAATDRFCDENNTDQTHGSQYHQIWTN